MAQAGPRRRQPRHDGAGDSLLQERAAWLELTAALGSLPLPSLVLASDGLALAANEAWTTLSAAPVEAARGDGWMSVVDPPDRGLLRARLREAVAVGEAGRGDFRLASSAGGRWSRWWWRPGPAERLLACVADLDEHHPRDDDRWRQGHGPLARLVRRSEFVALVGRALRRSRCDGTHVAVAVVGLGSTAAAADGTGQPDGDAVLRAVAERILGAVGAPGVVALVDRGEFAVLCGDLQSPCDAGLAANRAREALAQPLRVGGTGVPIATVTAFALASAPSETAESLIARACLAVRAARLGQPAGPDVGGMVVQRLFGIGLALQSAAGLADGLAAERLQQAVDELDGTIRELRTAAFKLQLRRHPQDQPGSEADLSGP